jgi:RNA polymerase sigma-70 factor (ECF subfamily)
MEQLETVFNRLSPVVFSVSLSILKSREEAEDVVQDIFVHKVPSILAKKPEMSLEELARLLVVTVKNLSIDVYRRRKKSVALDREDLVRDTGPGQGPDNGLDLKRAMEGLEPSYREVLTFKYLWGMTWQEVAQKIGLSIQGVRKRADNALKILRKKTGGSETNEKP